MKATKAVISKPVASLLSRFTPAAFRIQHSPHYRSFLLHHIASDPQHPLSTLRRREQGARKHEGLWWTVTSGVDLSKSSVVRSTCRRRLRIAFIQALRARGFDQYGRLVDHDALLRARRDLAAHLTAHLAAQHSLSLTGSTRLHTLPPLLATTYQHLRSETESLVDILLHDIKGTPPATRNSPVSAPSTSAAIRKVHRAPANQKSPTARQRFGW